MADLGTREEPLGEEARVEKGEGKERKGKRVCGGERGCNMYALRTYIYYNPKLFSIRTVRMLLASFLPTFSVFFYIFNTFSTVFHNAHNVQQQCHGLKLYFILSSRHS